MNIEEELNEILAAYPKDSRERRDLLRVRELTLGPKALQDLVEQLEGIQTPDICASELKQSMFVEIASLLEKTVKPKEKPEVDDTGLYQYRFVVPTSSDVDVKGIVEVLSDCVRLNVYLWAEHLTEAESGPFSLEDWTATDSCAETNWASAWVSGNVGGVFAPTGTVALRKDPGQEIDRIFVVDENKHWREVVAGGLSSYRVRP